MAPCASHFRAQTSNQSTSVSAQNPSDTSNQSVDDLVKPPINNDDDEPGKFDISISDKNKTLSGTVDKL